jgi:Tfp pilus assembly protein PilF
VIFLVAGSPRRGKGIIPGLFCSTAFGLLKSGAGLETIPVYRYLERVARAACVHSRVDPSRGWRANRGGSDRGARNPELRYRTGVTISKRSAISWLIVLILLFGLIAFGAVFVSARRAIDREAQAARAALSAGRPEWARGPLERWMRARPKSAEAHALLAEVALSEGDLSRVKREIDAARALGYEDAKLERLRGLWLARLGRYAEAEPILTALYAAPGKSDPAVDEALARIFLKTYRLRRAKTVIDRWIEDAPADGRPFLWLTEIDRRTDVENPQSWEQHYREALRRNPELDAARHGLAESLRRIHRNEEAAQEFQRYLSRHPDDPVALAGAGLNAVEQGDLGEAARLLDHALALAPSSTAALKARAEVDLHKGQLDAARQRLDKAVAASPFDDEAVHTRARVRSMLGDTAGAQADVATFNRLKRDQAELLALRETILNHPNDNDTRAKAAVWCFGHGRPADGMDWAMAILASEPNHAATCLLLADYYTKQPDGAGLANFYRLKAATGQESKPGRAAASSPP